MKELMTASRMACLLDCPRKHFWRYEIGMRPAQDGLALRFGTAWHAAMEARWQHATFEDALAKAVEGKGDLDALAVHTLAGLLSGYYAYWADDPVKQLHPEVEFRLPLEGSRTFDSGGKIDGLAVLNDNRLALGEHKTTSADIGPDSEYWLRLQSNQQLAQYVLAARALGWNVDVALYDVTRKPSIAPKEVPTLDENGAKIVHDATGARVFKKDGSPRESADKEKGYVLITSTETPEQFGERLAQDCRDRPEFYFARREVPILEQDLDEFVIQRLVLSREILSFRAESRRAKRPHQAWPRHLTESQCKFCEYRGFCVPNIVPDPAQPPTGFVVGEVHSELMQEQ